jgi:hypothetical protein
MGIKNKANSESLDTFIVSFFNINNALSGKFCNKKYNCWYSNNINKDSSTKRGYQKCFS